MTILQRISILEKRLGIKTSLTEKQIADSLKTVGIEINKLYPTAKVVIKHNRATVFDVNKKPILRKDMAKIINDYYRSTRIEIKGIKLSPWKYELVLIT